MIDLIHTNLTSATDFLNKRYDKISDFLDKQPTLYKVVLVACHLFRALPMLAMIECLPFSLPVSAGLLLLPALLYKTAVEHRNCTLRFTLPSLAGGISMKLGQTAAVSLASKTAFSSIGTCFSTALGILSLSGYFIFICNLSHEDIEKRMHKSQESCCH